MKLEISIFVVLSMMARERLKFLGYDFQEVRYVLRENQGRRGLFGRIMCDLLFAVWLLVVHREGEENAMKLHGSYFQNALNAKG